MVVLPGLGDARSLGQGWWGLFSFSCQKWPSMRGLLSMQGPGLERNGDGSREPWRYNSGGGEMGAACVQLKGEWGGSRSLRPWKGEGGPLFPLSGPPNARPTSTIPPILLRALGPESSGDPFRADSCTHRPITDHLSPIILRYLT